MKSEGMGWIEKVQRFLRWNVLRPAQKLSRGWAYSDLWNLYSHTAELVYPRLQAYVKAYRSGKLAGMYPSQVLAEFKDEVIAEGHQWDEVRWAFKDSDADERIKQLWLGILENMLFSFEWVVQGEPIPEDCMRPNPRYDPKAEMFLPCEDGRHSMLNPAHRETEVDTDKYRELENKVQRGFDYFGKYFRCLWD
jgi:hypothetical protein